MFEIKRSWKKRIRLAWSALTNKKATCKTHNQVEESTFAIEEVGFSCKECQQDYIKRSLTLEDDFDFYDDGMGMFTIPEKTINEEVPTTGNHDAGVGRNPHGVPPCEQCDRKTCRGCVYET